MNYWTDAEKLHAIKDRELWSRMTSEALDRDLRRPPASDRPPLAPERAARVEQLRRLAADLKRIK